MSKYDALKEFQSVTPEQKLAIVGHELVHEIAVVSGYSALLKNALNEIGLAKSTSDDWDEWINQIIVASNNMSEILNIMTSNS